jgi:hypothetical protein
MKNFIDCETKDKRDLASNLAGTLQLGNNLVSPIGAKDAVILLPTPWSLIADEQKKRPYDTSLLTSNILIQIIFEDASSFISVNGNVTLPNAFLLGEVLTTQETLTDKSKSLRNQLKNNENIMSQYPFHHLQEGTTRYLSNINPQQNVRIDLNSFITSDLLGIMFFVAPLRDIKRTGTSFDDYSGIVNRFNTVSCIDLKLEYNGAVLHDLPYRLSELVGLSMNSGSIKGNYAALGWSNPNTSPIANVQDIYYMPLTQHKSTYFSEVFANTPRFAQQVLQLSFTPEIAVQTDLVLYSTYIYNGISATSSGTNTITYA